MRTLNGTSSPITEHKRGGINVTLVRANEISRVQTQVHPSVPLILPEIGARTEGRVEFGGGSDTAGSNSEMLLDLPCSIRPGALSQRQGTTKRALELLSPWKRGSSSSERMQQSRDHSALARCFAPSTRFPGAHLQSGHAMRLTCQSHLNLQESVFIGLHGARR